MLSVKDILQPENVSYTDNVWTWAVAHMLHKGEDWQITTITDTAPIEIVFLSKGEPLTDYLISGNTLQDGTPTPEAPVDVVGCGVWDETNRSYKLPLTIGGTEYPIYLGQVPTTRGIKKLVLTGEEDWTDVTTGGNHFFISPVLSGGATIYIGALSTHYIPSNATSDQRPDNSIRQYTYMTTYSKISIRDDACATLTDFKSWLADQYSAGTPVTIWYILAEPAAGIVNEPLMKIGEYDDTISMAQAGVTIPTVAGENTLTIDTTVQPSAVSITGNIKEVQGT